MPFLFFWYPYDANDGPLFFFFNFYCYSITVVCLFSPSLHPTPGEPTSLPHLHPPPWFCPCVLYSSSCNPLSSLSPAHSSLPIVRLFFFFLFFYCFSITVVCVSPNPSTPPQPNPPASRTSTLHSDFVHVSFRVVPVIPSPHCPLPIPPCPLLDCS